jgi:hypothetical protein
VTVTAAASSGSAIMKTATRVVVLRIVVSRGGK